MKTYKELFETRGGSYHHAMMLFPQARDQEFEQMISSVTIDDKSVIADIPAGGGYLKNYLPEKTVCEHEPCNSFQNSQPTHGTISSDSLLPTPWENQKFDVVFSLAGMHHIDNKKPLFKEIARITKPGGCFVLSDVFADSNVALFLDGFVGDNNSTGHEGLFLDNSTLNELKATGWKIKKYSVNNFLWVFPSRYAMSLFCQSLFDIRLASLQQIEEAIEKLLGTQDLENNMVGMRWSLMTIVATK